MAAGTYAPYFSSSVATSTSASRLRQLQRVEREWDTHLSPHAISFTVHLRERRRRLTFGH